MLPMTPPLRRILAGNLLSFVLLGVFSPSARAQWAEETFDLKAGWNAIWLPLDCSYAEIPTVLTDSTVEQIWRWNPPLSTTQFTVSPQTPLSGDVQWSIWDRSKPVAPFSTFFKLTGNVAYLVKVADSVGSGTISVVLKGKPVPPRYAWKESGVNLFGFPTPPSASSNFEQFFSYSAALRNNPPTFAYLGGAGLEAVPTKVTTPRTTAVQRGRAYWVQNTGYSDYYGPLKVTANSATLNFGSEGYLASMRIKNTTGASLSATFGAVASATPPAAQPAVAGMVPLQLRGLYDPVTSQYSYATLPQTVALAAGEEREIVFTLQRSQMGTTPGAEFQSLVRVSDSLGLTQVDLAARAVTTSLAGLWVGEALVDTIDQVVGNNLTPKPVSTGYPVRFLVHMDDSGHSTLLQQAYIGDNTAGTRIATTRQANLDQSKLASASRISTANFPLDMRVPNGGPLGLSGSTTFLVQMPAGAATNPFLHNYHPDHRAAQSFAVNRKITLNFASSLAGITDPTFGSTTLGGTYDEVVSGLRSQGITDSALPEKAPGVPGRGLRVSGTFVLRRVANLPNLIAP